MKILLDECLPLDFRHSFSGHDVHTAQWAGLKGKTNGELLRDAELAGYEVLLTVDQGITHQQNLAGRKISIILLRSRTNQLEDLLPFVDAILNALESMIPGRIVPIESIAQNHPLRSAQWYHGSNRLGYDDVSMNGPPAVSRPLLLSRNMVR